MTDGELDFRLPRGYGSRRYSRPLARNSINFETVMSKKEERKKKKRHSEDDRSFKSKDVFYSRGNECEVGNAQPEAKSEEEAHKNHGHFQASNQPQNRSCSTRCLIMDTIRNLEKPGTSTSNMLPSYYANSETSRKEATLDYLCHSGISKVNIIDSEEESTNDDENPDSRLFAFPPLKRRARPDHRCSDGARAKRSKTVPTPQHVQEDRTVVASSDSSRASTLNSTVDPTRGSSSDPTENVRSPIWYSMSPDSHPTTPDVGTELPRDKNKAPNCSSDAEDYYTSSNRENPKEFFVYCEKVCSSLCDSYGNELSTVIQSISKLALEELSSRRQTDSASEFFSPEGVPEEGFPENAARGLDDEGCELSTFLENLSAKNIPLLRREEIVLDFLRPALREAGERACSNGEQCVSIVQFEQLWNKDRPTLERNWRIRDSKSPNSSKIIDEATKTEFRPDPLREFLLPASEAKRKEGFSRAMLLFINKQRGDKNVSNGGSRESPNQSRPGFSRQECDRCADEIESWLSQTLPEVNPQTPGQCILCVLKLRSELSANFSNANSPSFPSKKLSNCLIVQHHRNVFGIPGEYKSGYEIIRGSSICGLVAPALEYRVTNYLPALCTVYYRTIEVNQNPTQSNAGKFKISEKKKKSVRQWVEIEDMVCNPSDVLSDPKQAGIDRTDPWGS